VWAAGFTSWRLAALLAAGIGATEYVDSGRAGAHNSFVQAYVELGLWGGHVCLWRPCATAARMRTAPPAVRRRVPPAGSRRSPVTARHGHRLWAPACSRCSRNYIVPTYLLCLACRSYLAMVRPDPPPRFRLSRLGQQTTAARDGGLFFEAFTQLAGQLGQ